MIHVYKRRVHFADTDAAGVVHFSRLLCYAEEAEHDLLGKLGIPLTADGGWPRVHVDCDYLAPARAGDLVEVTIRSQKIGASSMEWTFSLAVEDTPVASGGMTTVRVNRHGEPTELDPRWRVLLTRGS